MKKSFFVFVVSAVLINLFFCYAVGRCAVGTNTSSSFATPSEDTLASAVNASALINFNESSGGYSNTYDFERNTSDRSFEDETDRLHFESRWEHLRERRKQQRLFIIQNRIEDLIGASVQPNVTSSRISDNERRRMAHIFEILQTYQQATEPEDVSAERVQSFYPSCTLPRNTDRTLWEDPRLFHVYYDIPSPHLSQSTSLTVSSAKLRLFKSTVEEPAAAAACEEIEDDDGDHFMDRAREIEDHAERLRISIFQYVRPLRRSRRPKKKKLVDSRMVAADYAGWLDFDVGSSIRDWLENSSKNLGLEIVLEDALANTQNPSEYLHNMNCSEGIDRPFPHFTEAAMTSSPIVEPSRLESGTYPTLDLRTVEVMETETATTASIKKNEIIQRHKRQTDDKLRRQRDDGDCDDDGDGPMRPRCCGVNLNVSFKELGFDGIVAPESFHTKACVGHCRSDGDHESNVMQACSPSVTEALVVLHYNENGKLVIRTIPDLIVKSCSCNINNNNIFDKQYFNEQSK